MHYKVLSCIGSGGMGEVYLAKDNQLERKVAIKVLRKKFGKNEDGLQRFIREARSASALNHPNIITIYEIGELEGANYISSEYIDGNTLHSLVKEGSLSISKILDISTQTAEAISAAHAAGIIHRDIKPENVMIRKDGYVKVLDFGLAKLTEREVFSADFDAVTHKLVQTNPGVVMGTVSYMSPEQTRGKDIDTRSDIWSLGVVIYEMIAGVRPFAGESTSDVIAAILTSNPRELSKHDPNVPKELEHIVNKALRKDREERYQDVKDMLIDLRDVRRELDGGSRSGESNGFRNTEIHDRQDTTDSPETRGAATRSVSGVSTGSFSQIFIESFRQHPKGMVASIAALLILTALAIAVVVAYLRAPLQPDAFQTMRFSKLTSSGNAEGGQIAISPDGKYATYVLTEGADQSLWVRQINTEGTMQIVPPSAARFHGLTFHPDSGYIYFVQADPNGVKTLNRISVLGGEVRKILTDAEGPVSFSPGGDRFAFIRNDRVMMTANADGSSSTDVAKAGDDEVWWLPVWSPDGKTIAATVYSNQTSRVEIFSLDLASKAVQKFTSAGWMRISGLGWNQDGKGLKLSGRDPETQLSQIWKVAFPGGEARRVTNDSSSYQGLSMTADGKTAVSVQEIRTANIWIENESNSRNPKKVTSDVSRDEGMSGVAWGPEGSIVFTTRITGSQDIWSVNSDGSNEHQLTDKAGSNFHPAVSPDGTKIAFTSDRAGSLDIWQMDRDGNNASRLTDMSENESRPSFTPDGKWVIFQRSGPNGLSSIWKIPAAGGESMQISPSGASVPQVSPDGKSVVCELRSGGTRRIGIFTVENGIEIGQYDFPEIVASSVFDWSPDGSSLVYVNRLGGEYEVWSQPLPSGTARRLSTAMGDRIFAFDISRNGKGVVFSRGIENSDVIIVNGIR